ncbi:MAG: arginine--tRNA ligase [bacterium]|nr:arginine--tRNA ligase [bacterium]
MLKTKITDCLKKVIKESMPIEIFVPENEKFGHYSTNVALQLAKLQGKNPMEIAEEINLKLKAQSSKLFEKIETAPPGFINFWLSEKILQDELGEILKKNEKYGSSKSGGNKKINIEFISANPTGPLTIGNGRGGFCGDVLANVLKKAGYKVAREYYINDTGEQIKKLGHSVLGDEQAVYSGDYIEKLRKKIAEKNPAKAGEKAAKLILKEIIKPAVEKIGIKFNKWFSEKSLYKSKAIEKIINELDEKNLTYRKEGATWFKSTKFGDDKDRVLIKTDGEKAYFTSDIAYLKNKFERDFDKLIIFLGADHYGYIGRVKAAAEALGYKKENLVFIIIQLVRLIKEGKEVRMSKRTGSYITIDELIDEVGLDAARFFFLMSSPNTHMDFDLDLAKEQSSKNPVYYVQYAAVRCGSVIKKSLPAGRQEKLKVDLSLLDTPEDINLMRITERFPEVVEEAAKNYNPQILVRYSLDLAKGFHNFYEKERIIGTEKDLLSARLALLKATQIVFQNLLNLLGISLPRRM